MQAIERIMAALNAASCGPWIEAGPSFGRPLPEYLDSVVQDCGDGDCSIAICRDTETSDASYIAACNPAAMAEVLAHITALEAENKRLRSESEERLQNAVALVAEVERINAESDETRASFEKVASAQFEMMAKIDAENERLRKDAERYRWLAAHARITSEHWGGRWSLVIDGPAPKSHNSEDDLDAAIDAAMKGTP